MKIKQLHDIQGRLPVGDPFILAAYHYDLYPAGNGEMGPVETKRKSYNGSDFDPDAAWRMYHGDKIPGFPYHPHRGFEIVTYIPEGFADHCDSRGSRGRYGEGDVQLMSAGKGVLHSEMFPLLHDDRENPLRLFQIWLNLPSSHKLTEPGYKMIWSEQLPQGSWLAESGGKVTFKVLLGEFGGVQAKQPLPHSWAANPANHVRIVAIELEAGASFELEAVSNSLNRQLFYYEGQEAISVDGQPVQARQMVDLVGGENIPIANHTGTAKLLLLEGEPIGEPVAAYGPFVMNTPEELEVAFAEYKRTQFGGWPWGPTERDMVNDIDAGRFASYDFGEKVDHP